MFYKADYESFTATRFAGLGVAKWGNAHWFFVDTTYDASEGSPKIGASYKTKAECLADASRFAGERGFRA